MSTEGVTIYNIMHLGAFYIHLSLYIKMFFLLCWSHININSFHGTMTSAGQKKHVNSNQAWLHTCIYLIKQLSFIALKLFISLNLYSFNIKSIIALQQCHCFTVIFYKNVV